MAAWSPRIARKHLATAIAVLVLAVGFVVEANRPTRAQRDEPDRLSEIADDLATGTSVAVSDLDLDFRRLREEQIKRLPARPDVVLLGGDQWREAGAGLVLGRALLNLHVPLDYYDDALGMVEALVRHDKLPKDLVIGIRGSFFAPPADRTDVLWQSGIANVRAMIERLSLSPAGFREALPLSAYFHQLNPANLYSSTMRSRSVGEPLHSIFREGSAARYVLHADGSVRPSSKPDEQRARAEQLGIARGDALRMTSITVDPVGFEAFDRLLSYLRVRNVAVHLVLAPLSPPVFERIRSSRYMEALGEVRAVAQELAEGNGLRLAGSFDPGQLGCTDDMFIDAEHASASCVGKLLAEVLGTKATEARSGGPDGRVPSALDEGFEIAGLSLR